MRLAAGLELVIWSGLLIRVERLIIATIVVIIMVMAELSTMESGGAEHFGKHVHQDHAHGRHANADDSNVNFNNRINANPPFIPGRVGGVGECDQGVEAEN